MAQYTKQFNQMPVPDALEDDTDILTEDLSVKDADKNGLDGFDLYMSAAKSHQLLNEKEEKELAVRIAAGDKEALDKLVSSNLRLVVSIAKRYQGLGLPLDDLIQEGNIGLITAAKRFDPERGTRFTTYAVYWIRQSIGRSVYNNGRSIRLPVHVQEKILAINQMQREMKIETGTAPTAKELAKRLDIPVAIVEDILDIMRPAVSLDAPVGDEYESSIGDFVQAEDGLSVEEQYEKIALAETIKEILAELPEKERTILEMRFGLNGREPMTLEEVGEIYGVTRERIRQIEKRAIRRLKLPSRLMKLKDFVR